MNCFKQNIAKKTKDIYLDIKTTRKFTDKSKNDSLFVMVKYDYWAFKSDTMNLVIDTLFKNVLKKKTVKYL